jgi:hypothetical protein
MDEANSKKITPRGLFCWGWVVLIYAATLGIAIDQISIRNRELKEQQQRAERRESDLKRLAGLNSRLKISVSQWQEIMLDTVREESHRHEIFQQDEKSRRYAHSGGVLSLPE